MARIAANSNTAEPAPQRQAEVLAELCTDFFVLGRQISSGQVELPDPDTFRRRLMLLFESLTKKAAQAGILPTDIDDARYALAAYIDEMIQYSRWPGRDMWAQVPLQATFFGESRAGRNFFERLARVRTQRSAALHVYYTCLALGFQGEYRIGHALEHERLVEDLARDVVAGSVKRLAPHGERRDHAGASRMRELSLPVVVVSLGLTLVVALALYVWIAISGSGAVELLQRIGRSQGA